MKGGRESRDGGGGEEGVGKVRGGREGEARDGGRGGKVSLGMEGGEEEEEERRK